MTIAAVLVGARGTGLANTATTTEGTTAASGSTFAVLASWDSAASSPTVTDSKANTYTAQGTPQVDGLTNGRLQWWVCQNGTGGTSHTATFTTTGNSFPVIHLIEVTGAAAASLDQIAQGSDSSSPWTLASPTLSQADEVVLCGAASGQNNPNSLACSTMTVISSEPDQVQFFTSTVAQQVVASTSPFTASWTDGAQTAAGMCMVTFKAAPGPTINTQPQNQSTLTGNVATFSVSATTSGGSLTYQWQDDSGGSFADISGATASTYATPATLSTWDGRRYRVNVTDSNGTTTSNVAVLSVILAANATSRRRHRSVWSYSAEGRYGAPVVAARWWWSGIIVNPSSGASTVNEAVSLSDAQTATATFSVARAESVALADAQTATADFSAQRDESVALTGAQSATLTFSCQRDETIALADTQTATATFSVTSAETVAVTDSQSATATFATQRDESVAVTDSQSATATFATQRDESVAVTDSQDATVTTSGSTYNVQADETISVTDSQSATATFATQRDESVAIVDSQTSPSTFFDQRNETVLLADSQDASIGPSTGVGHSGTVRRALIELYEREWAQNAERRKQERAAELAAQRTLPSVPKVRATKKPVIIRKFAEKLEAEPPTIPPTFTQARRLPEVDVFGFVNSVLTDLQQKPKAKAQRSRKSKEEEEILAFLLEQEEFS